MTQELVTFQNAGNDTVCAQIDLKASPERVFAAWLRPERFQKWFLPRSGGSLEIARFDGTAGGGFDFTMRFADGDSMRIHGKYLEVDPYRKMVFTWEWFDGTQASNETLVTLDLAPSDRGTLLTLTHARFATADDVTNHQGGWGYFLPRLEAVLEDLGDA